MKCYYRFLSYTKRVRCAALLASILASNVAMPLVLVRDGFEYCAYDVQLDRKVQATLFLLAESAACKQYAIPDDFKKLIQDLHEKKIISEEVAIHGIDAALQFIQENSDSIEPETALIVTEVLSTCIVPKLTRITSEKQASIQRKQASVASHICPVAAQDANVRIALDMNNYPTEALDAINKWQRNSNGQPGLAKNAILESVTIIHDAAVGGDFDVTGATTLGGTLDVAGNVKVNTDKFIVTATSGNTAVGGTLNVTGNMKVNTDKFSVVAASGNTTIGGTLGVTGATALSSALDVTGSVKVNTDKFIVEAASGNTNVAGTLGVTGATTLANATIGGTVGIAKYDLALASGTYCPVFLNTITGQLLYTSVGSITISHEA